MQSRDNFRDPSAFFETLSVCASELCVDIRRSDNQIVIFNFDLSVLYPFIMQHTSDSQPLFDKYSNILCQELTNAKNLPFKTIITSVTFWEMMSIFYRRLKHVANISDADLHAAEERLAQIEKSISNTPNAALSQRDIAREIKRLENLAGANIERQIDTASRLLGQGGPIKGLGDIFTRPAEVVRIDQSAFDSLFAEMWKQRASDDTRPSDVKETRYKVDVANIILSQYISRPRRDHQSGSYSNNSVMDYVTKAQHKALCGEIARLPLVPAYWIGSLRIDDLRDNKDRVSYFTRMQSEAKQIFTSLIRRGAIPEDNALLTKQMRSFLEYFSDVINQEASSKTQSSTHVIDSIREQIKGGRRSAFHEMKLTEIINISQSIIGDELMIKTGLNNDKYLKPQLDDE